MLRFSLTTSTVLTVEFADCAVLLSLIIPGAGVCRNSGRQPLSQEAGLCISYIGHIVGIVGKGQQDLPGEGSHPVPGLQAGNNYEQDKVTTKTTVQPNPLATQALPLHPQGKLQKGSNWHIHWYTKSSHISFSGG